MQLISREKNQDKEAKIFYNQDTDEYIVRFYTKGVHHENADYYTDARDGGKADALATARTIWDKHITKAKHG